MKTGTKTILTRRRNTLGTMSTYTFIYFFFQHSGEVNQQRPGRSHARGLCPPSSTPAQASHHLCQQNPSRQSHARRAGIQETGRNRNSEKLGGRKEARRSDQEGKARAGVEKTID